MPGEAEDVIINFVGKVDELKPVENALDSIIDKGDAVGEAWKKTAAIMAGQNKTTLDSTNKLAKSIEAMGTAAKSMDKAVIGGAYKDYLKQIQAQLGLTNKEVIAYIQHSRKAAQQSIFSAGTDEEIDQITLAIEAMNAELKELGVAEDGTGEKTQSLRARLREAKEELVAMADAGLAGTPAFDALVQKAGELDDQMKDLNAEVSRVGSNTKNIEGLISIASGVAGGFAIAQGAAALFGSENEELQAALVKVNAAMAILQGLQQIQNVLHKESAASLLLGNTARQASIAGTVAQTGATGAATVAQTGLNTAMSLNPVGLLIVGILAAVAAFTAFSEEVETSEDRLDRLTKKADSVYNALQKLSKINQFAIDREIDITKNKELVNVLEAEGASVSKINALKKVGLGLENSRLRDELRNIESAKEIAEDKNQFLERELAIKSEIYSNDKAQLILDIDSNKVDNERASKSRTANANAEVARKKLAIVQNQVDSIASIKAVSDAEIEAIRRKQAEDTKASNQLTSGEIAQINAEANLAIAENRKKLQQDLLEIETASIDAKVLLSKKGSEEEFNNKLAQLEQEKTIALANTLVTANDRLKIEADFIVKKRDLERAFNEVKMQDEISFLNAYIDEFGISEDRKLELTIRRLDMQRDLEISQAEGNAAKIREITFKYDKQIIDAKKASIKTKLDLDLLALEVYSNQALRQNQRIIDSQTSTGNDKIKALERLQKFEDEKFDLQHKALTRQVEDNLLTNAEFDLAYQDLLNKRSQSEENTQKQITAVYLTEIQKRTAAIQATFSIFQKGLSATLDTSAVTVALTEIQNFGAAAQDIFEKVKIGAISGAEGIKELALAAVSATQSIINQSFADASAARQQALAEELERLEIQKQKELDNENLTQQQKADIEAKFRQKEKQEKIKAFQADKEAKKSQAIINGALGIVNALATAPTIIAGIILAAVVAASTAVQVSKINSTPVPKFRHGKVDIQGPGTTTSDSIPAMISRGESVINARSTEKWKDALEAINKDKFEPYMMKKVNEFIFPNVPEHIQPAAHHESIDYDKLATAVAMKMKGIIPSPAQFHNTIDKDGFHQFMIEGNNKTEFRNKRYSRP